MPAKTQGNDQQQGGSGFNWLLFGVDAWAISLQIFLHKQGGARYFGGLQAAAVIVLIPVYCTLWPNADLRPMMIYLLAYLFMCLVSRIARAVRQLRGGSPVHSRYNGYPRLMKFFPRRSEVSVKRFVEPLVMVLGGAFMLPLNVPLGFYWIVGALCIASQASAADGWDRRRAADMYDSVLDQQELAERFRGMRGDNF